MIHFGNSHNPPLFALVALAVIPGTTILASFSPSDFRPPSVPLVVQDPFVSVWSPATRLNDTDTEHWGGARHSLTGMMRVDGVCYRFMGGTSDPSSSKVCGQVMDQQGPARVRATTTTYTFTVLDGTVQLDLSFRTPSIMRAGKNLDLDMLSSPFTLVKFNVSVHGDKAHEIQVYYDNTAEVVVSDTDNTVEWSSISNDDGIKRTTPSTRLLRIGTTTQDFNDADQSDLLNWGYWYVMAAEDGIGYKSSATANSAQLSQGSFAKTGELPEVDRSGPRPCNDNWPVLAVSFNLGVVSKDDKSQDHVPTLCLGFDDIISMDYFGSKMTGLYRRGNSNITDSMSIMSNIMANALFNDSLNQICEEFDNEIYNELHEKGGERYALLGSLAYRQVTGAIKVVWNDKLQRPWIFMKEISSDGDVSTVDVIFPACPVFMHRAPESLRLMLMPLLAYANNETEIYGSPIPYNLSWAPHHLGVWPQCNLHPMQQEQMPIEETANMLIMIAWLAVNQQDVSYLQSYWALLDVWGEYLVGVLPDPKSQLCTDDFEGPSPHNVNLAAKGITGIGAYSAILRIKGDKSRADTYLSTAKLYASKWMLNASAGDHYKLQYNLGNDTFSLKYNLLWDKVLNLGIFPQQVYDAEMDFYMKASQPFGVPLDNRAIFTKLDWLMWVGAMASDNMEFSALTNMAYLFAHYTPDRIPLGDWYNTNDATYNSFRARPVVGGIWAKMLMEN